MNKTHERLTENGFPWIGQRVGVPAIAKPESIAFSRIDQLTDDQRVKSQFVGKCKFFKQLAILYGVRDRLVLRPVVTRSKLVTANVTRKSL